ncbi:MAG: DUF4388 domain-containing protein [Myxococcota bacterium]
MSLVGSLEDLGLVDILQIVSLSRKSGALFLRCDRGEGRILLRDGLVQGAQIKGAPETLRALLIEQGLVDGIGFDCARERAEKEGLVLDVALEQECQLAEDQLNAVRREHVERSAMRMFTWRTGEFSFEIRDDFGDDDSALLLPAGLNTQYLAMEATRLGDETTRADEGEAELGDEMDLGDDMMFSGEEPIAALEADEDPVAGDPIDELAMASAQNADPLDDTVEDLRGSDVPVECTPAEATPVPVAVESVESVASPESAEAPEAAQAVAAPSASAESQAPPAERIRILVAVDPDLSSLEWLKASVEESFQQVHIFQQRDLAVERIRQYLVRGKTPMLVMSDPTAKEQRDVELLVQRMRGLAPRMPILALRPEGIEAPLPPGVHAAVFRPSSPSADPDRWHLYEGQAQALRANLEPWVAGERRPS